ncbi:MAG: RNA 2',3'-cyclic phosphodiesterase [Candidatus Ozemobacteraceae bacterium]
MQSEQKSSSLRLFFAIVAPEQVCSRLIIAQRELSREWRPVRQDQLHLTLAFLAKVPDDRCEEVFCAGRETAEAFPPFELFLADVGGFPNLKRPRVLVVHARGEYVQALGESLLQRLGSFVDDRRFTPHLTIARSRGPFAPFQALQIEEAWNVGSIELIKSTLNSSGPTYETLRTFPLCGSSPAT